MSRDIRASSLVLELSAASREARPPPTKNVHVADEGVSQTTRQKEIEKHTKSALSEPKSLPNNDGAQAEG